MPKQIIQDAVILTAQDVMGEAADVLPMTHQEAVATLSWPAHKNGQPLPVLNWVKPFRKYRLSSRYACMSFYDEYDLAAALCIGVTKDHNRIALTHLSRNMRFNTLAGKMAEIGLKSLKVIREGLEQKNGTMPSIAVLNPLPSAVNHYKTVAEALGWDTELVVGGNQKLLYLR